MTDSWTGAVQCTSWISCRAAVVHCLYGGFRGHHQQLYFYHHMYADDTQLLAHMSLKDVQYVGSGLKRCIIAIQDWCSSRRVQLNPDKTGDLVWIEK